MQLVILALLGCLAAASAARMPDFTSDDLFSAGSGAAGIQHLLANRGKKGGDERAYASWRYIVPTDRKEDFVSRWQELEKATADEKANEIVDLKKTMSDNFLFTSYAEWKTKEAFLDHLEADHTKDFVKWTLDNNIIWDVYPLLAPAKDTLKPDIDDNKRGKKEGLAHVLIKYTVPPEEAMDFVKEWQKLQEDVDEEEGVRIYSLRKPIGDNYTFIAYGTWDSWEAYMHHFKSKALAKFLEYVDDSKIAWKLAALKKMGDQPE